MKTLVLNIPDTVDFDDKDAVMTIASRLYEKGKLSLGQGVELVGQREPSWKFLVAMEYPFLIIHLLTLTEKLRMQKVIISDTSKIVTK